MSFLKKSFWSAAGLTAAFVAGGPQAAAQESTVSADFNRQALGARYALSCPQKKALRSAALLPPADAQTPSYFQNDGDRLAYFSPRLSNGERRQAEALITAIPRHVTDLAYSDGAVFVFPKNSLVEAAPRYKNNIAMWTQNSGMYFEADRRVTIPFARAVGRINSATGTFDVFEYRSLSNDRKATFFHELGHMVDDLAGNYLKEGNPQTRLTYSPKMVRAYERDLQRFAGTWRNIPEAVAEVGYLLPQTYNGTVLGGDHPDIPTARKEAFAELWAQIQGNSNRNARIFMPNTYRYVQEVDRALRQIQRNHSTNCALTANNS